jgi:hypothetical protein
MRILPSDPRGALTVTCGIMLRIRRSKFFRDVSSGCQHVNIPSAGAIVSKKIRWSKSEFLSKRSYLHRCTKLYIRYVAHGATTVVPRHVQIHAPPIRFEIFARILVVVDVYDWLCFRCERVDVNERSATKRSERRSTEGFFLLLPLITFKPNTANQLHHGETKVKSN